MTNWKLQYSEEELETMITSLETLRDVARANVGNWPDSTVQFMRAERLLARLTAIQHDINGIHPTSTFRG